MPTIILKDNQDYPRIVGDLIKALKKDDNVTMSERLETALTRLMNREPLNLVDDIEGENPHRDGYLLHEVGYQPSENDYTITIPFELVYDKVQHDKKNYLEKISEDG